MIKLQLEAIADSLVPVAGELMRRACSDTDEHLEDCDCSTCRAFVATQKAITELSKLAREIK